MPAALQLIGSSVGEVAPGKVNLMDLRLVLTDAVEKILVTIFKTYHVFHRHASF
jgi:hypothetical protein